MGLEELLISAVRESAKRALERLAKDDHPEVRNAAMAALSGENVEILDAETDQDSGKPGVQETREPQPVASEDRDRAFDLKRIKQSIWEVAEGLGGQPPEYYMHHLPQVAAAEVARRIQADVVVLLLDNGQGLLEVSGGVGLTAAERHLSVEYNRDVMRELFRAGVGLIEDTDQARMALAGIPGTRVETLVMVPLVHEQLGFGVLMAGRRRTETDAPPAVFTDTEIEVLMGFADGAAQALRGTVRLRQLEEQLRMLKEE